jgi:hypothetical protein
VKRPRKTTNLSKSLNRQLNSYALAASAAGVAILALTQPSEAKIVYTPTRRVIGKNGRYKLDLNHDKLPDFTLVNTHGCNSDYCIDALSAIPSGENGVEGAKGFLSIPYASALQAGARIGPEVNFSGRLMASSQSGQGTLGKWLNVNNGYLGLKFTSKGKTHYGWARLTVQVLGGAFIKATLTGYAYETIPNKPVIAGRTNGPDVVTVQPASLGHLAHGASAIPVWRAQP